MRLLTRSDGPKKLVFLLVFIGYRLHEHDFSTDILGDLFNFKLPEVGCLDLDLSPGHCDDTVLGRLDTLTDFLAFTYIDLHDYSSLPYPVTAGNAAYGELWL